MITISNFKGINNTSQSQHLAEGDLRECVDFAIQKNGYLKQRFGYTSKDSQNFSCIGGDNERCFAVRNGDLVEVTENNTKTSYEFTTLKTGLGDAILDFCECDGRYYFVGDNITGVIDGAVLRQFGLPMVNRQPDVTVGTGGLLNAGQYLVAVTLLDNYGRESGTIEAKKVTVSSDNSSLILSNFPDMRNDQATDYAVYVSTFNGEIPTRQGVISIGTPTLTIYDVIETAYPLMTTDYRAAPVGSNIAYGGYGVLYISFASSLYFCKKYAYDFWNPLWSYEYDANITAIMPCESGIWIGTEKGLYWINGRVPDYGIDFESDFVQTKKHNAKIEPRTSKKIPPEFLNSVTHGWCCSSDKEIFLLLDGGQFQNITQEKIKLSEFDTACGAIIQHENDDCFRYMTIYKGANVPARSF